MSVPLNGTAGSKLTIETDNLTPKGTFTMVVVGTSGNTTHGFPVSITVNAAPDFILSVNPTGRTVT